MSNDFEKALEVKRPLYVSMVSRLRELLPVLLDHAQIPIAQVEGRAKDTQNALEKMHRKSYQDPLSEMKDLAGLRIVTYYQDDVQRVADLIRKEFVVDEKHSTDKLEDLKVDEFGYRSFHLVCTLNTSRAALPEWGRLADLTFEIQVRSVLQHAWAAISHKLDYKSATEAPQAIRRQLFRLSALLELADNEFASIRDHADIISEGYRERVDKGDLAIPLDLESLREFLSEQVTLKDWVDIGIKAGMRESHMMGSDHGLRRIHAVLQATNAKLISEAKQLMTDSKKSAARNLKQLNDKSTESGYQIFAEPFDIIALAIGIKHSDKLPSDFAFPKLSLQIQDAFDQLRSRKND